MINYHKTQGEWKIHLINFFSAIDSEEIRTMHSKRDNIQNTIGSETDKIIENLFDFFFTKISRRITRINERK